MVFLNGRKRPPPPTSNSSLSSYPSPKNPNNINGNGGENDDSKMDRMVSIVAEAGCTLINPSGPPCLPSDPHKFRAHLTRLFSSSSCRSDFLSGFSSYINFPKHLRRVLVSSNHDGFHIAARESLVRHLLLVPSIQLDLQNILLEKLPEYFDYDPERSGTPLSFEDDVARLIVNQFRWLEFIVDPVAFTDKLMQIISICPLHLKKEIIGSLPEIIGDQNNKAVVDSLEQMLQEDSGIVVPVLDSLSNLDLDDMLQEQVIMMALSFIKTIDGEHMPFLLRFLLLSATPQNIRRIISHIREKLTFVGMSNTRSSQLNKQKGKSTVDTTEANILDALRSGLMYRNVPCQEILKELSSLEKASDHKVIDIWLLVLIYMSGESMQKSAEKIFKRKVVENCIQEAMVDQCICGNKALVQGYFRAFLSLSEYLLTSKEQRAREFGVHMYACLFQEFADAYHRQEILGSLVTHVGSGVSFEVDSSVEILGLLASKHPQELIPLASHINGILDYLEGFSTENLHKVYEVFGRVALSAQSCTNNFGSSFANELMMIVQKQVSHPDFKYKKMGLVGTLKLVSCLGDANNITSTPSKKSKDDELLELLRTSIECCKQSCLTLVLFYDELRVLLDNYKLQPSIIEWIGKNVGEFESTFLSDIEGGKLPGKDSHCDLEGELWMNLDGDISPICLSIFPLVSSSKSTSLQILPASFLLLSSVERSRNQGSLGGIDALLGCPLHLPSIKYFMTAGWQLLTARQKQIVCLSVYYAINWIRELLNAFCTQVTGSSECISQATKEDMIDKLMKRLRNLIFLETLLNKCLKSHSMSLPELHLNVEHSAVSLSSDNTKMHVQVERNNEKQTRCGTNSSDTRKKKKMSKASNSQMKVDPRQPTIMDVLKKAGAVAGEDVLNENSSGQSHCNTIISTSQDSCTLDDPETLEVSAVTTALEAQRLKFRPLLVQCFCLLAFSKNQGSCCADPAAELPLYLYLLRDLQNKLDYFSPPVKRVSTGCLGPPAGSTRLTMEEFLNEIRPLFPNIRKQFDCAVSTLKQVEEIFEDHWKVHSGFAGNPDMANFVLSKFSVSTCIFKEVLHCFSKILSIFDAQSHKPVLSDLLEAFQPDELSESVFTVVDPSPLPGTLEYLYLGTASFIREMLNIACLFSFTLASESLFTLEAVVISVQKFLETVQKNNKSIYMVSVDRILPTLRRTLFAAAQKLIKHNWGNENLENGSKNKGETIQKVLRIYLDNSESQSDLLDELACSILHQVSSARMAEDDDHDCFPTLSNATFAVWYRALHESNLNILNKLVKEIAPMTKKSIAGIELDNVEKHLEKIQRSVNVLVSLIDMCRTYEKVTIHSVAVKYGGKFVDLFLKVFDFLQINFQTHNELVIQTLKDLQKATRTIQTLCSEAKGMKQTVITSKVPATKRSLERFLFRVKALLHTTPNTCTFWMGNLKHKDLAGQVVSSQVYVDHQNDDQNENFSVDGGEEAEENIDEDQALSTASADVD